VAALHLQAFAGSLVSVGVRAVPLGQAAGQGVLAGLAPLLLDLGARAAATEPEDIATSALGADLDAMAHEALEVRVFRS
jgi:urease accessory protein